MIPCPRFAGKMNTKYFHLLSENDSDVTRAFPTVIKIAPVRTKVISFPHRDMTMPAIRPPMGVAREGIARRAPAFVAESRRTTWKKRGNMKRYFTKLGVFSSVWKENLLHMQPYPRKHW